MCPSKNPTYHLAGSPATPPGQRDARVLRLLRSSQWLKLCLKWKKSILVDLPI
jgi:hypothetical protein